MRERLEQLEKNLNVLRIQKTNELNLIGDMIQEVEELKRANSLEEDIRERYNGKFTIKDILVRFKVFSPAYLEAQEGKKFISKVEGIASSLSNDEKEEVVRQVANYLKKANINNLEGYIVKSFVNAVENKKKQP